MLKYLPPRFRPVTLTELNHAWTKTWRELETLGLACPRLAACEVWLSGCSKAYGWQWFGDRPEGRPCGDIIIPSVSLSRWFHFASVLDVLRHEYGHAYADVNRRRIETNRFEKAFGAPHDISYGNRVPYDPDVHVTQYAAASTGEDFAETFWLFLKHKGRAPARFKRSPAILRKWNFIATLAR